MLDVERFLSEIEPFSSLDKREIQSIAHELLVEYYKKGEIIYREGSNPLEFLYILRSGGVVLEKNGEKVEFIHEGECFGYVSLMTSEPPNSTARTVEDSVVFLLNKKIVDKLIGLREEFRQYFARKLVQVIGLSTKKEEVSHLERYAHVSVESINLREALILDASQNVDVAVKLMVDKDSTFALVKLPEGLGIITERDILKKVLAKGFTTQEVKLREIATFPVISIDKDSSLYEALVLMAKHGIRKLVVKRGDEIYGVLEDRDVIAYESKNALLLIKEIDKAKTTQDLSYIYFLLKEQVLDLVFSGTDPERLGEYISEINDHFMKRAVYIALNRLGEEPLVPFSIMVLGSEGRREQSLKTDQDNALIYQEHPPSNLDPKDYFEKFSKVYIEVLLEIGFPPCPGNVMLSNPFWRRSLKEWKRAIEKWIENPKSENILNIAIFFDFRNVYGDQTLAEDLWKHIQETLKENPGFIPFLAVDAVRFGPPIGFFGDFVVEKSGEHKGNIDIKKGGIFPIIQGVRALALEKGIEERNTFERIERLKEVGLLSKEFARDLKESYRFLLSLRFKTQAKKIKEGKEPDNYINPKELSRTEKSTLKDTFKVIKEFQTLLYDRYNLRYFE